MIENTIDLADTDVGTVLGANSEGTGVGTDIGIVDDISNRSASIGPTLGLNQDGAGTGTTIGTIPIIDPVGVR